MTHIVTDNALEVSLVMFALAFAIALAGKWRK